MYPHTIIINSTLNPVRKSEKNQHTFYHNRKTESLATLATSTRIDLACTGIRHQREPTGHISPVSFSALIQQDAEPKATSIAPNVTSWSANCLTGCNTFMICRV